MVRAPDDGYVIGLSLRPGHRVAKLPMRSFMSFVISNRNKVTIGISQHTMRHVRIGQPAEVTFNLLPGKVFSATVADIAPITQSGHLTPSGDIPLAPTSNDRPLPFSVMLKFEDDFIKDTELSGLEINHELPGGALGSGAIYTDSVKLDVPVFIVRKIEKKQVN